jgi:hypothetical protein
MSVKEKIVGVPCRFTDAIGFEEYSRDPWRAFKDFGAG